MCVCMYLEEGGRRRGEGRRREGGRERGREGGGRKGGRERCSVSYILAIRRRQGARGGRGKEGA